jgi:hypothetical protein
VIAITVSPALSETLTSVGIPGAEVAVAGLASRNTSPEANNPANKIGTATKEVSFEGRKKRKIVLFISVCGPRLKNEEEAQPTFGQTLPKNRAEYSQNRNIY